MKKIQQNPDGLVGRYLKHVFKIDVLVCTECGGTLKAIAAVRDPDQIARYLKHVGLGSDPPLTIVKLRQGALNYEVEQDYSPRLKTLIRHSFTF